MIESQELAECEYGDSDPEEEQFGSVNLEGSVEYGKMHAEAVDTITQLKMRLLRRTAMIDDIRKCYLRDVVVIKNVLHDVIIDSEREIVIKELANRLPSLDLTKSLPIHAPTNTELRIAPCESCGGRVEAVLVDSDEVVNLQKVVSQMRERESRFKSTLAELDAKLEAAIRDKAESSRQHHEEKRFLYSKMKEMEEAKKLVEDEMSNILKINKKLRKQNEDVMNKGTDILTMTERLRSAEEEIRRSHKATAEDSAMIQQHKANEKKHKKEMNALRTEIEILKMESTKSHGSTFTRDVVISSLEDELSTHKNEIETLEWKLQKLMSENTVLQQQNQDLIAETRIAALTNAVIASTGENNHVLDEIIAISDELREEVKKWQNENEILELKIKMLEGDITMLKKESKELVLSMEQKELSLQADREFFAANSDFLGRPPNTEDKLLENITKESHATESSTNSGSSKGKRQNFGSSGPAIRRRHSIPGLFKFGRSSYNEGITSHGKLEVLESKIFGCNNTLIASQSTTHFHAEKLVKPEPDKVASFQIPSQTLRQTVPPNQEQSKIVLPDTQDRQAVVNPSAVAVAPQIAKVIAPQKKFVPPKEKVIELLPPSGDGNAIELLLRNSFIKAMSSFPEMTQNAVYRAMNAIAPSIASYSKLICQIMQSAWDSIANGRCLMETILQINTVLGNMKTCISDKTSKAQLDRICEKSSSLCESLPSPDWDPPFDDGHVFMDEIMCSVAAKLDDTGKWTYTSFEKFFFHKDEAKVESCIEDLRRLVTQFSGFSRETFPILGTNILTILMDWQAAKSVSIDLDNIVKQATNKVRIEADTKVSNIGRELQKQTDMFENVSTQLADMKEFTKELLSMEESLRKCEELLSTSEHNREVYIVENGNLKFSMGELKSKIKKLEAEVRECKSQLSTVEGLLSEEVKTKREAQEKVLQLSKNFSEQMKICNSWQAAHDELIDKESARKNAMRNVSIQWAPTSTTVAIQTEFLTQPMTLRTVVAENFGKLGAAKYPLPMIVSQPQTSNTSLGGGSNLSVSSVGSNSFRSGLGSNNGGYDDNASFSSNGQLSGRSMNSLNSSLSSLSGVSFFNGADMTIPSISLPYTDQFDELGDHTKDGRQDSRLGLRSPTEATLMSIRGSMKSARTIVESSNTLNMISRSGFIMPRDLPNVSSPNIMPTNRSTSSLPSLLKSGRGDGEEVPIGYNAFAPTPARLRTADSTSSTRSKPRIDPYNIREIPSNSLLGTNLQQARTEGAGQGRSRGQPKNKAITQSIAALQKTQELIMAPLL